MYQLVYLPMRQVPEPWKVRMRELSFGGHEGSMWRWTYHDGSTYAATIWLSNPSRNCRNILAPPSIYTEPQSRLLAWACLTEQEEPIPVAGVYVDHSHRRRGLGQLVAGHLLAQRGLPVGSGCYAVAENWGHWPALIESFGLVHYEWE